MGQTASADMECMKTDRIICQEPYMIHVGAYLKGKEDNPYKMQVIRVNDKPLKTLVSFVESSNALQYEFEDNISLKLMKKDNDIVYHIKTDEINHTGVMNDMIRKHWKDVSWNSKELDRIGTFVKVENVN
jgi:hypothetical protein